MFGSFFNKFNGEPDKSKKEPETESGLSEDVKIKNEKDEMEREDYNLKESEILSDIDNEIQILKQEVETLFKALKYTRMFISSNPEKVDLHMPFGDFLNLIEDEKFFNESVREDIHDFIDKNEGKINMERSVQDFLDYMEKVLGEKEFLLDPGPEVPPLNIPEE